MRLSRSSSRSMDISPRPRSTDVESIRVAVGCGKGFGRQGSHKPTLRGAACCQVLPDPAP